MKRGVRSREGFTLIEIVIVIAIIGIIATVVLPRLDAARSKAQVVAAQVELDALKTAMEQLHGDTGLYPNGNSSYCRDTVPPGNEVDLASSTAGLLENGAGWDGWKGPYVSDIEDPWGNSYYLDEDYQCMASTTGCHGIDDAGNDSSVIVSCGPNEATADGSCTYDTDNVVYRLCDTS